MDPSAVAAVPEETVSPKSTVKPLSQKLGGMKFVALRSQVCEPKVDLPFVMDMMGFWGRCSGFSLVDGGGDYAFIAVFFFFRGVGKNGETTKEINEITMEERSEVIKEFLGRILWCYSGLSR